MSQKSEKGREDSSQSVPPGTLYLCGTPIGNLKDASQRLLEVLSQVDAVLCEDTRRTLKLLSYFQLKKRVISFHEHVEKEKTQPILDMLSEGKNLALVSDAGMPCISDPGHYLVRTARERGISIVAVPGPSSVTSALALSGFPGQKFIFMGFPPRKAKERETFFQTWLRPEVACIFFESPFRLTKSLESLSRVFPEIEVCLCHEITKAHESTIFGKVDEVLKALEASAIKGEWVVVAFLGEIKR